MNLEKMFQMQKDLDDRIRVEHNLVNSNLIEEKILAFQVELGELANETRCFKYWSLRPASARDEILEEYVDGVHFLLSIGLDLHTTDLKIDQLVGEESLTKQFALLFELSGQLGKTKSLEDFINLFQHYIYLGKQLNFTPTDIEAAYIGKNEVNHQRQNQGY